MTKKEQTVIDKARAWAASKKGFTDINGDHQTAYGWNAERELHLAVNALGKSR